MTDIEYETGGGDDDARAISEDMAAVAGDMGIVMKDFSATISGRRAPRSTPFLESYGAQQTESVADVPADVPADAAVPDVPVATESDSEPTQEATGALRAGVIVDDAVTWEITNVVDPDGDFYSRSRFRTRIPELVFTTADGTIGSIALTSKVARHMHIAFRTVDNIYSGAPAVEVAKKRVRNPITMLSGFLSWWGDHKIKGTIGVIIFGAVAYSVISGIFILATT